MKGQRRFDEAEALLLSAYSSLSIDSSLYLRDLLDLELQLTDLYDSMNKVRPNLGFDAKAAEWRGRLNSRQRTTQPADR